MYVDLCKIQFALHSFILWHICSLKVRKSSGTLQKTNILRLIYPLAKGDF